MSCCVRNGDRKDKDECGIVRASEIIAHKATCLVVLGKETKAKCSSDIRAEVEEHEPDAGLSAVAGHVIVDKDAAKDRKGNYGAVPEGNCQCVRSQKK